MRYLTICIFTLLLPAFSPDGAFAQTRTRKERAQKIESLREEIKTLEAELLAPSRADQSRFAEFLAQPDTGLIRLLPREKWDYKLSLRGGGAYYYFPKRTQEYGFGSDIGLEQGMFSVGFAGANFGFIAQLGDIPLENVTMETEFAQFLATFAAPTALPKAREQQRKSGAGFQVGELTYKSHLPALLDSTYLLRSINYELSDVLVAFRVVRKDDDGSMILLWKTLSKFPKPHLENERAVTGQ